MTITGALKESMTNLRDGHRVTINSSGPVRITSTATGARHQPQHCPLIR
jgi:hypothetical protein